MKITFLGAAHEVTGSCTLVEVGKTRFIVDCGMEQGRDMFVNQTLPVSPAEVDFALLTHAHIDHSGNLPLLAKNGFSGPVYATAATCSLADIMLRDSAHIQMSEAEYKTRKAKRAGEPPVEPIYDVNDVEALVKHLRPCAYGEPIHVAEGVAIRFTDIGHLLGSACIEVWLTEDGVTKKIVFSGDVGNTNQPILRDPDTVAEADYDPAHAGPRRQRGNPRLRRRQAAGDAVRHPRNKGKGPRARARRLQGLCGQSACNRGHERVPPVRYELPG